jgi:hypothetical protein
MMKKFEGEGAAEDFPLLIVDSTDPPYTPDNILVQFVVAVNNRKARTKEFVIPAKAIWRISDS